jgi:hypothetical protein
MHLVGSSLGYILARHSIRRTDQEIRFVGWPLARAGGSPWRRIVDVERDGEHLGEAEACPTAVAAAALATDLDRELADDEVAARCPTRSPTCAGEDLSD